MKAVERVAQYNTADKTHRVVDMDKFGREVGASVWRPDVTKTHDIENWMSALLTVGNYRLESKLVEGDIISFSRKL
mgnify:CR=1 FL=1